MDNIKGDGIQESHPVVYRAFISYSHAADSRLAPAIQSGLHRFAKPWYRARGMRVFRDETNLAIAPGLWDSIEESLRKSAYFILFASPRAAQSKWVRREVSTWLAERNPKTLLLALTEGEIRWDSESGDFDWQHSNALPNNLANVFPDEPKYADFTWAHESADLSLRNPRFAMEIARLVSAIQGRPLDELIGEDVRQSRRMRWMIAAVFITIVTIAGLALWQWQTAVKRQQIALSRQLANQAINQLEQRTDLALLLGVEANRVAYTVDALGSLLTGLCYQPELVTYLRGHSGTVRTVAISPDGASLASSGSDGTIVFWDLSSRRMAGPISQHRGNVEICAVAFSPDGMTLASGSLDHTIQLWDSKTHLPDGAPLTGHSAIVNDLAFNPDGRLLASGDSEGTLKLWSLERRVQDGVDIQADLGAILAVAVSRDGSLMAAGGERGVTLWDLPSRTQRSHTADAYGKGASAVAFSPDSQKLVAGFGNRMVVIDTRNSNTVEPAQTGHTSRIHGLSFDAAGKFLLSGGADGLLIRWDAATMKPVGAPRKASRGVSSVVCSEDGSRVVTGNWDGSIALWDFGASHPLATELPRFKDGVSSIGFSPDGRWLVSASYDGTTILWDFASGHPVATTLEQHASPVLNVEFSSNGKHIASKDAGGRLFLLDADKRTLLDRRPAGRKILGNPAFTPRGEALLYGSLDGLHRWDLEHGEDVKQATLPSGNLITKVVCSGPEVGLAALSGRDGSITLVDASTLQTVSVFSSHAKNVISMVFSPDGKKIASCSDDQSIALWSVSGRERLWQAETPHAQEPLCVAFSWNGKTLASGGSDGSIILWDVESGQPVGSPLHGHEDAVEAVAFRPGERVAGPDGTLLASAGRDGRIRLWKVGLGPWQTQACRVANRDLSDAEWQRYVGEGAPRGTCAELLTAQSAP